MLNVFLTVDTEVWPRTSDWRETGLRQEIDQFIYGKTCDGEYGIGYQIELLNRYGLKAVFLVEALFSCIVGIDPLRKIVDLIQQGGREVQLHIHTEWLAYMPESILPGRTGQNLKDFSEAEQTQLIARGVDKLRTC